ncbi:MAG: efflux RND transporter periplasmic adaptor subunit, partial [Oleibacter sp.]|nr:efflux RND transporter periplasmic adaptor subunit [Thalassolituus sp.]
MSAVNRPWKSAVISIAIIALGVAAYSYIKNSAPKPQKKVVEERVRLVDAEPLTQTTVRPQWQAGGTVMAARHVNLGAEVSGRIEYVADEAIPGATLTKGTVLAKIDNTNYEIAVHQARAAMSEAEANMMIERGQVSLAKQEYDIAGSDFELQDSSLVLREPQLQVAKARLQSAESSYFQARKNLERTEIRMPFNGQIISRAVSVGTQASTGSSLFDVMATDEFWIEVKMPRDFAMRLDNDKAAILSHDSWDDVTRSAEIMSRLPQVEERDRQARVILSLKNPLSTKNGPAVYVNDYVSVSLYGREIKNAYVIPRRYLNENNTVWVVNQGMLADRQVDVAYMGRENVWVMSGFEADDYLLTTLIDAPVNGTKVRISPKDTT